MPFGPIHTWDDATLDEVCASDETSSLERKSGLFFDTADSAWRAKVKAELAKQVSAFSNAETGHIVFGVSEKPVVLDDGVPLQIGRTPLKDWVEALVPTLVEPPVVGVQGKVIQRPGFHRPDRGVLVVEVPLSSARPHWVPGNPDVAYIRAGAHSAPMSHHTLLDIANRQDAAAGEVFDLHVQNRVRGRQMPFNLTCYLCPSIGLVSLGGVCREWGVELAIDPQRGHFLTSKLGEASHVDSTFFFEGREPLLPGRRARLGLPHGVLLAVSEGDDVVVRVTLFAAGARPACRSFSIPWPKATSGRGDAVTLLPMSNPTTGSH